MRFLIFIPIFFLTLSSLRGQTNKIDSLKSVYDNAQNDDDRLEKLDQLTKAFVNARLPEGRAYIQELKELARKTDNKPILAKSYISHAILSRSLKAFDSIVIMGQEAKRLYKEIDDEQGWLEANYQIAWGEYCLSKYDEGIERLNQNIAVRIKGGDSSKKLGNDYNLLGTCYLSLGEHQNSIDNFILASEVFKKNKSEMGQAEALDNIGYVEYLMKNYDRSIEYMVEAAEVFERLGQTFYQLRAYRSIAGAHIELDQLEEAKEYLNRTLPMARKEKYRSVEASTLNMLGQVAIEEKRYDEGVGYFEQALKYFREIDRKVFIADLLESITKAYVVQEKYSQALPYADEIFEYVPANQSSSQLKRALKLRSEIYEQLGMYQKSLVDYKGFEAVKDSLLGEEKQKQIEQLRAEFDTERKDTQIDLLQKESELDANRKKMLWGGLGLITLLGASVIIGIQRKRKKEQELHAKQQELEIQKRKATEQELAFKQKELAAKLLQLANKNQFLEDLQIEVGKLKTSSDNAINKTSELISRMIKSDDLEEDEWDQFTSEFTSVHQDFVERLNKKYGSFTRSEMRLISLLKMNLSSKEMASILRIAETGVRKARYRLRKKMELDSTQDLSAIIHSI